MIDKARYYLALVMLAAIPPAILFWFSIHPFIRFWRRIRRLLFPCAAFHPEDRRIAPAGIRY
jgi:hypothetical protein